jgi:agmatine deiminase
MEKMGISKNCRITIGLVQMAIGPDPGKNLIRAANKVKEAARKGAQVICLPELFTTRYFPQSFRSDVSDLAEPVPGPTTELFSGIARDFNVVIIVPLYEKAADCRFYNTAMVIDADGSLYTPYHKVHIPQDPGFYEKGYFFPGDSYPVYTTRYGRIAVLICYDQWFPEAARSVALEGASIIFYPTAIGHPRGRTPEEGDWRDSWEVIQRSHAVANSVHVAAVNRVGWEDDIEFFGGSFVCDAFGKVLVRADKNEKTIITTIDLSMNEYVRDSWGFIRNRRPGTYKKICEPFPKRPLPAAGAGGTPRNRGFLMPAEWELHESVWLSWPHSRVTFPNLEAVEEAYIAFIAAMKGGEQVNLLLRDEVTKKIVRKRLDDAGAGHSHVTFRTTDYADVWIRDYGPTFLVHPALRQNAMVQWNFNAWGGKYDDLLKDGKIPAVINQWLNLPGFNPGVVLEGGSVDVNGRGTIMTTRSCLLNPNRNPSLSEYQIEEILMEYLGGTHVIWLEMGIAGDDTDGHIDDIARFTGPSTVVCAYEERKGDENYHALHENYKILKNATDQNGKPLKVVKLLMPSGVSDGENRYPASYTNFYIGNTTVIVPVFDDRHDRDALRTLQGLFPDRNVTGIDARAMVEGFGTFHCATQQQPVP